MSGKTKIKRVFVSIPMRGRSYQEIKKDMQKVILKLNDYKLKNIEYKLINSLHNLDKIKFSKECRSKSVECLSRSIKYLSTADVAYFYKGWEKARGCKIEHEIAKQYGLEIIDEEKQQGVPSVNNRKNIK